MDQGHQDEVGFGIAWLGFCSFFFPGSWRREKKKMEAKAKEEQVRLPAPCRSNIAPPKIDQILKTLDSRKIIKAVKSVVNKNKKVYMLYELEPSKELTGGAWYTDQQFDAEFTEILTQGVSERKRIRSVPLSVRVEYMYTYMYLWIFIR